MDFYTKMFLVNFIILFFVGALDKSFLADAIENGKYTKHLYMLWNVLTLISIPSWIVYLIVTW